MQLLFLTTRSGGGIDLLPSLGSLGHEVSDLALDAMSLPLITMFDAVVVDATQDLRAATAACQRVAAREHCPAHGRGGGVGTGSANRTWAFDDWVLPTASPAELETRLQLVGRVGGTGQESDGVASIGDLVVNEESYQVRLRGEPLDLTYEEFELLRTLASHPGRVYTRELLLQEIWGYDYFGGSRTVDVHIRRLRAKLSAEHEALIGTVRGVGYKLAPLTDRNASDEWAVPAQRTVCSRRAGTGDARGAFTSAS